MKELRLKENLTQLEVANYIGIARSSYTNIENARQNPSLKIALKIKAVLKYKEDDLFFISSR